MKFALLPLLATATLAHAGAVTLQGDPLTHIEIVPRIPFLRYPWHSCTSTVFWAGERPSPGDPGNLVSAWDADWLVTAHTQNPYYVALPYNDVDSHHTKMEARSVIPWFAHAFVCDGQSVCKDRWVELRHAGKVCYAQWEDVGPFQTDHWQYVFGNERPRPNRNHDAGIDVSPAVRDYLGLSGLDTIDWRFCDRPASGPWMNLNQMVLRK